MELTSTRRPRPCLRKKALEPWPWIRRPISLTRLRHSSDHRQRPPRKILTPGPPSCLTVLWCWSSGNSERSTVFNGLSQADLLVYNKVCLRRSLSLKFLPVRFGRGWFRCLLIAILSLLFVTPHSHAYSVLTHEQVVDLLWKDQIEPLLRSRFPQATDEDLRKAHAYAYGGSLVQDMGYYP